MTWEMDFSGTVERLSVLTDACTEYLAVRNASSNMIQTMTPIHLLERKLINIFGAIEMVF